MRRNEVLSAPLGPLMIVLIVLAGFGAAGCSGDDDGGGSTTSSAESDASGPRFCDVYLDYLATSTPENLAAVDDAADDADVTRLVDILDSSEDLTEVLAATLDLDELARERCQSEWTAGAQGAGNTPSAAQAFLDALVAGDPLGARNVASANAIAVFEPWEPRPVDRESGTPTVVDIDDRSFSIALDTATLAECQVETGVVVACQIAE